MSATHVYISGWSQSMLARRHRTSRPAFLAWVCESGKLRWQYMCLAVGNVSMGCVLIAVLYLPLRLSLKPFKGVTSQHHIYSTMQAIVVTLES